jgi:hypothetical protein
MFNVVCTLNARSVALHVYIFSANLYGISFVKIKFQAFFITEAEVKSQFQIRCPERKDAPLLREYKLQLRNFVVCKIM